MGASTSLVLQVAGKQHTITALELAKHPDSLLSRLAAAELDVSSNSSSSSAEAVKVLQLDSMGPTPLADLPDSAAPVICSLYRCAAGCKLNSP